MKPLLCFLPVRQTLVFLSLCLGPLAKAAAPIGSEARQFDFAVGEWSVESLDGRVCGSVRIETVAEGAGLTERWTKTRIAERAEHSLLAWSNETRQWRQLRVTNAGVVAELNGRWMNGSMIFEGVRRESGASVLERVTWTPLSTDSLRQIREESIDDAHSWRPLMSFVYRRMNTKVLAGAEMPKAFRYLLW